MQKIRPSPEIIQKNIYHISQRVAERLYRASLAVSESLHIPVRNHCGKVKIVLSHRGVAVPHGKTRKGRECKQTGQYGT